MASRINQDNLVEFHLKPLIDWVSRCIRHEQAALIMGPPGVGKTQICCTEIERLLDIKMIEVNWGQMPIHMAMGIGYTNPRTDEFGKENNLRDVDFSRPIFIRKLWEAYEAGHKVGLFIDEMPNGDKSTVSVVNDIMHRKAVGEHKLPPDCAVVAAGNGANDGAVSMTLFATQANRVAQCRFMGANVEEYVEWGLRTGRLRPEQCAYLEANPTHLYRFDPDQSLNETHRSWEMLTKWLADQDDPATAVDMGTLIQHLSTMVSPEVSAGLAIYIEMNRDLTPLSEIVASPSTAKLPQDRDLDPGRRLVAEIMQSRIAAGGVLKDKAKAKACVEYYSRVKEPELRAAFMSVVGSALTEQRVSAAVMAIAAKAFAKEYRDVMASVMPDSTTAA